MYSQESIRWDFGLGGSPVVFFHAFPLNRRMWEPQERALDKAGIPWFAFDYPGFGESQPPSRPLHMDDYAELAFDLLSSRGVRWIIAVGLSMGGYVALSIVRRRPEWLRGLVLADTRATADDSVTVQKRRMLKEEILHTGSMEPLIESHLNIFFRESTRTTNRDRVRTVENWMKMNSIEGVITALDAMAGRPDSRQALQDFKVPTLVLVGEADPITTPEDAREMVRCLPHSVLDIVPGSAHLSNLENSEHFNRSLLRYLRTILNG